MNRINLFRSTPARLDSLVWGKTNFDKTASTLVFAGLLIVCSVAVGCSSDKPKPASSNNQVAMTQPMPPITTTPEAPVLPAKPVHKKVVRKAPVTVTYEDKASGVSFQYLRKYSLETGDAANQLISSDPVPMNFVQPGELRSQRLRCPHLCIPTAIWPRRFSTLA